MAKPTQQRITRDSVTEELLRLSGGDKKLSLYFGVIIGFLALPFIYAAGNSVIRKIANGGSLLDIVLSAVALLILLALVSVFFIFYFVSHRRIRKIKKGAFSVRLDRVTYMTERMKYNGRTSRLARIFEFRDSGEAETDGLNYSLTSIGDEYYLVFIDGEKQPTIMFPCKIYDYEE